MSTAGSPRKGHFKVRKPLSTVTWIMNGEKKQTKSCPRQPGVPRLIAVYTEI